MFLFTDVLLAFLCVVFFVLGSILIGKGFTFFVNKTVKKSHSSDSIFWNLIIGTILSISFYAIYCTNGITLFFIVPIIMFFIVAKGIDKTNDLPTLKQQFLFLGFSILFNFLFYAWAFNSFDSQLVTYVSGDFNIYFRIAQKLNESGIETLNLDPIYLAKYAAPYHYGDIWLYAFISRTISLNPSIVFFIAFTHLSILFINGIYTFAYKRFHYLLNNENGFLYILLFSGLFTGFNLFFPKFIIPSAEPYTLSVVNWSKVLIPSTFIICLLILSKDKNWWALTLLAMIGGLFFINALPAIFMTVFIVLTINALKKNITFTQWLQYHLCYVLITVLYIIFLYKALPNLLGVQMSEATGVELKKQINIVNYLSTAIKIFIGGLFQLFVLTPYIVIFLIGFFASKKTKSIKTTILNIDNDLLFIIAIVFSGLFCWAILHPFAPDAVQFYTNILAPVYSITISFLVLYIVFVFKNKIVSFSAITLLIICLFVHKQDIFFVGKDSKAEWQQMKTFFTKNKIGNRFASIRPHSHFNSFFDKNTVYFMPLGQLVYLWPDYHNFSLNAPFIGVNNESLYANEERIELDLAPFSLYYKAKLKDDPTKNIQDIMIDFVHDQKVAYLTVSKDTFLPFFFRPIIKDSMVLKNANIIVYKIL